MFVIDAQWDPKNLLGFHDFQDPIKASESNTSPCIPCSSNLGQVMIVMCPKVSKSVQKRPKVSKSGQISGDQQGINRAQGTFAPWIRRLHGPFSAPPCWQRQTRQMQQMPSHFMAARAKNSSSNSARSFGSLWVLAVFFLLKIVRFQTAEQHRTS